ncbi:MAG: hypothetical protein NT027_09445 [Proteobacteria bacterium]|nr:hypothetical protein [Pseudomonadota bacterium]
MKKKTLGLVCKAVISLSLFGSLSTAYAQTEAKSKITCKASARALSGSVVFGIDPINGSVSMDFQRDDMFDDLTLKMQVDTSIYADKHFSIKNNSTAITLNAYGRIPTVKAEEGDTLNIQAVFLKDSSILGDFQLHKLYVNGKSLDFAGVWTSCTGF